MTTSTLLSPVDAMLGDLDSRVMSIDLAEKRRLFEEQALPFMDQLYAAAMRMTRTSKRFRRSISSSRAPT